MGKTASCERKGRALGGLKTGYSTARRGAAYVRVYHTDTLALRARVSLTHSLAVRARGDRTAETSVYELVLYATRNVPP